MYALDHLREEAQRTGKPQWRTMLEYVAELHAKSIHPPREPFPFPWEEIGPGYCYGPAFGHWDIVHAVFDSLRSEPEHAMNQLRNNLTAQRDDGFIPGAIWMKDEFPRWSDQAGHPPVWPIAVDEYTREHGTTDLMAECYVPLLRQIRWFENNRSARPFGFYYTDILNHSWESGIDEGIRFLEVKRGPFACVDATAHIYALYDIAGRWSDLLGKAPEPFRKKADELRDFIQNELFVEESGFFHDLWSVNDPRQRCLSYEGMWPLVVGAATQEQAERVIGDNLLNPRRFLSRHPISTVGLEDPHFELRMWRGPAWNSMTYWAARGCVRYGNGEAARTLLEMALDASGEQFERTGMIWEFYHPHGGKPEEVQRKPHTHFNTPCRDYLGHNPLIAMARLYDEIRERRKAEQDAAAEIVTDGGV